MAAWKYKMQGVLDLQSHFNGISVRKNGAIRSQNNFYGFSTIV